MHRCPNQLCKRRRLLLEFSIALLNRTPQLTFIRPPASTTGPQARAQESIALVAGFELDEDAELVRARRDRVRDRGVVETLGDLLGTGAPALGSCGDVGRGIIVGLQQIIGVDARSEVFDDELVVLAAGLEIISESFDSRVWCVVEAYDDLSLAPSAGPLTTDDADPVASPKLPVPTEILGLSLMLMRKSSSRVGVGSWRERAISPSPNLWSRLLAGMDSFMTF